MSEVPNYLSYLAPSPLPAIDDDQRAAAAAHAGDRVIYYDPSQPSGAPLSRMNMFGWRVVGPDGTFTGEEFRNSEIVPHPDTVGYQLTSKFDLLLWRLAGGFSQLIDLVHGLFPVNLLAKGDPRGEGELLLDDASGTPELDLCSSPTWVPRDWTHTVPISGADLVEVLGRGADLTLCFNRDRGPGLRISAGLLSVAFDEASRDAIEHTAKSTPVPAALTSMGTIGAQR